MVQEFLKYLMSHPGAVVSVVLAALALWKGKPVVEAALASKRAKEIMGWAHVAFHAVEEAASLAPDNAKLSSAAKLALYLDKLDTLLEAHGSGALDDAEKPGAEILAGAINAAQKAGLAALDPSKASA